MVARCSYRLTLCAKALTTALSTGSIERVSTLYMLFVGLELAELTTFPPDILENSRKLAHQLRTSIEQRHFDATESGDLVSFG